MLTAFHQEALRTFTERVRQITDAQWNHSTPCAEWSVRDLVNHLAGEQLWAPLLLSGLTIDQVGDRFDGDVLGPDPVLRWERVAAEAAAAFSAPGVRAGEVHLSYGTRSAVHYLQEMADDLVVHSWDLGRAIEVRTPIPPSLVTSILARYEPRKEELAKPPYFRPALLISDSAPAEARMAALFGRDPNWAAR
ncbi:TIGR03086 family metal-binding protein [Streptomyces mirabilis]|uniref:TIGR03086 family metal-binding protein n=1 Tax=Streptomyces mirabilis TaxID=68239 RepID=UPI0032470DA5